jgi:hypothetical protein
MIIMLRGTSGSGKTYIVNRVMERLGQHDDTLGLIDTSMKKPANKLAGYYWCSCPDILPLSVIGRYDVTCGGCDTLSWPGAPDDIERLVKQQSGQGNVLLEGLMVSAWGGDRLRRLGPDLTVIHLNTSLEDCLAAVNARRAERGARLGKDLGLVNPHNTTKKHAGLIGSSKKHAREGLRIVHLDRAAALARTFELLRIPP